MPACADEPIRVMFWLILEPETSDATRYITVDVLPTAPWAFRLPGLDAGGLSTAQMQAIAPSSIIPRRPSCCRRAMARMTRECAFLRCRAEIPFAGHPNVGTAFVLATQATKPPARLLSRKAQSCARRNPPRDGSAVGAELTAPQPPRS